MVACALIAWVVSTPAVVMAKPMNPSVIEWKERFRELAAAQARYRDSLPDDVENLDRIFPPQIHQLHEYSDSSARYLKTKADWQEFERQITVNAYSYEDIKEPIGEYTDTVVAEKDVRTKAGSRFIVILYSKGMVSAIPRKEVLVLDVIGNGSFRVAGNEVADKDLESTLRASGVSNREVEIRGRPGALFSELVHARALCERASAWKIRIEESKLGIKDEVNSSN